MEKHGSTGHAIYDNVIRLMRSACWITRGANTRSGYVILLFYGSNGYANAPQCCNMQTLPILFRYKENDIISVTHAKMNATRRRLLASEGINVWCGSMNMAWRDVMLVIIYHECRNKSINF